MDGKSWLTGQNWVDQFLRNCANEGHTDLIRTLKDGESVCDLIGDMEASFYHSPEGDETWNERSRHVYSYDLIT